MFFIRYVGPIIIASLCSSSASAELTEPDNEYKANHCEFYVDSFARERLHYGGGGYDEQRLAAYIKVDEKSLVAEQGGKILRVGMYSHLWDNLDPFHVELTRKAYAHKSDDQWVVRQSLWKVGHGENWDYRLKSFAFFVDVQRADKTIDRLWLTNGEKDFKYPEVFDNYPVHNESRGPNSYSYVKEPSPLYNQKKACK